MALVRYARSLRDQERDRSRARGRDAALRMRSVTAVYETDAEVVSAVVPRPLEVTAQPDVEWTIASIEVPAVNEVSVEIRCACFGVRVEYDGQAGIYPLAISTTAESGVALSRERFGMPTKRAKIDFDVTPESVSIGVERMGIRYVRATGRLGRPAEGKPEERVGFGFKAFPSADPNKDFDQDPQLLRFDLQYSAGPVRTLAGGLELWDSPFDPVADLPVRRLSRLEYREGSIGFAGRVLRPVPGEWLTPFLHQRYDAPETIGLEV